MKRSLVARRAILDVFAVLTLILLCYVYWWRVITPERINQQSLIEGDFSGQFVSFATYQTARMGAGEIPLWNPYNLGGHPFLADTQAAVFYPPRLITVALLNLTNEGDPPPNIVYDALQREMIAHSLIASLLMYTFVRRLTIGQPYSPAGGLVSGIIFAYGGYMTGYPPLQLALMEASVWLPLILLGILEGTRHEVTRYGWFALSGGGLALALLAGHPQTALFTAYFALAYLAWQIYTGKKNGWVFLGGAALVLGIGGGIAAVQLLPAWEYLGRTTRDGLSFLAKGNGFPFYDLFQMILPGLFSQWSPLYVSVAGVIFIGYLAWRYPKVAGFWGIAALVTVTLSFGAQTILYDLAYNFLPGFSLFRGQERAAYLVTVCGAILAGLGASQLLQDTLHEDLKRGYQVAISSIITPSLGVGFAVFSEWVKAPDGVPIERLRMVTFSVFIAVIAAVTILGIDYLQRLYMRGVIIVALIGIELFTFGRLISPNLENRPALERLAPAPAIDALIGVRGEQNDLSSRIDTIPENYGTAYALPDIRGTSPLRLATVDKLLNVSNQARLWEVFAVRWVLTPNQELSAPASIVYSDAAGGTNLHALRTPRPFARLVGTVWVEPNDDAARGILNEPAFDSLTTVILEREAGVALNPDFIGKATLLRLEPEWIVVTTEADSPTVLDVALVYYPGWTAEIDGQPAPLLKADTAMTALAMPAGEHTVTLRYSPQSYHLGMVASLAGLLGTGAFLAGVTIQARRRKRGAQG